MQSIYIHIYIYTNFESKTSATKKNNRNNSPIQFCGIHCNSVGRSIIPPSPQWIPSFLVDHPPTRWFHPEPTFDRERSCRCRMYTVIPVGCFFFFKGGCDFGGWCSFSWSLWSCVAFWGGFVFGCELFLRWLNGCLVKFLHVWGLLSLVNLLGIFIGFGDLLLIFLDY